MDEATSPRTDVVDEATSPRARRSRRAEPRRSASSTLRRHAARLALLALLGEMNFHFGSERFVGEGDTKMGAFKMAQRVERAQLRSFGLAGVADDGAFHRLPRFVPSIGAAGDGVDRPAR